MPLFIICQCIFSPLQKCEAENRLSILSAAAVAFLYAASVNLSLFSISDNIISNSIFYFEKILLYIFFIYIILHST